jgi:hypothetical protein
MIMNCETYQQQIDQALARQLDPGRDPGIQAHLSACVACRDYAVDQKALFEVLVADRDRTVPSAVRAKFSRLMDGRPAPAPVFSLKRWVYAGAFAGVVTALLILFNRPVPPKVFWPPSGTRSAPQTITATAEDVSREFFVDTEDPTIVMATLANYSENGQ